MNTIDKTRLLRAFPETSRNEGIRNHLDASPPQRFDRDALEATVQSYVALGYDLSREQQRTLAQVHRILGARPFFELVNERLEGLKESTTVTVTRRTRAVLVGPPSFGSVMAPRIASGQPMPAGMQGWLLKTGYNVNAMPVLAPDCTRLYALVNDGVLSAHDVTDGSRLWSHSTGAGEAYTTPAVSPDGSQVLVVNGGSCLGNRFDVTLLDSQSGNIVWMRSLSLPSSSNPKASPIFSADGTTAFVPCSDDRIRAYDVETGDEKWPAVYLENCASLYGSPIVTSDGKTLLVPDTDGGLTALDAATGAQQWRALRDGCSWGTPSFSADERTVYITGKQALYAYDVASGQPRWSRSFGSGLEFERSRARAVAMPSDGALLLPAPDGKVYVLDGDSGEVRKAIESTSEFYSAPALSHDGATAFAADGAGDVHVIDLKALEIRDVRASRSNGCFGGFTLSSDARWAFMGHSTSQGLEAVKLAD